MKVSQVIFNDDSFIVFTSTDLPGNSGGMAKKIINTVINFKREQEISLVSAFNTVINCHLKDIKLITFKR
jgi:hypothetical protein